MKETPRLYGIHRSNRDFSQKDAWGKNQFNSSFPAALACYMYSQGIPAVYLASDGKNDTAHKFLDIRILYGADPMADNIYFSFETQYLPFQKYIKGFIPRNDLVIMCGDKCISSLEIKLSALPDNSTCEMSEDRYGSEIVVRPDTIIYLACCFIKALEDDRNLLGRILSSAGEGIKDWSEVADVIPHTYEIYSAVKRLAESSWENQMPLIMQPVWKTEGKSPKLAHNCLDIFVWSNCGLLSLFMPADDDFSDGGSLKKITRHSRTMIWLFKMLKDYAEQGYFIGSEIIDRLSYNLKNDKAFSSNGLRTHPLMRCAELTTPRITRQEIRNIILGGGQALLSPERRFDAIIYNSPDLF